MKPALPRSQAFTLVEVLVAMAVLSLLVLIMVQVVSLTGQAININTRNLDAAGQARFVLDRIGIDLAARPHRSDLPIAFTKNNSGSDCFRFYSRVASYTAQRGVTAVGYRIQTATPGRIYQLERGVVGLDWTMGTTGLQFLPQTLISADADVADNADYEVLGNGVFRLEFGYLLKNGTLTEMPQSDFTNVAGIVIAIGVLDNKSQQLLTAPSSQLLGLSNALVKAGEGEDPLSAWTATINKGLVVSGVPKPVLQNIHVYERAFYVQ
jgi:prepilin-type N-terminal cleavage/methylation domain-containing protein